LLLFAAARSEVFMLRRIQRLARISVARGCAFAGLAIATLMVGLSGDMVAALEAGGILSLLVCVTLLAKAWLSGLRSYKSTEVLRAEDRPDSTIAQELIGTALRDTCLRFAYYAAGLAAGLLWAAVLCGLIVAGEP
jgi:hypothetical protein